MSRALDDAEGAQIDRHVARHLGINLSELSEHPYEIDEVATNDGTPVAWRVSWSESAPSGVRAQGGPGDWWNDIPIADLGNSSVSAALALSVLASAMTPELKSTLSNSSLTEPVTHMELLLVGNEMTRFMHNIVGTLIAMDGHTHNSLEKLASAATGIDDFAAAVLAASHWHHAPDAEIDNE